jgi:hypothetical protein
MTTFLLHPQLKRLRFISLLIRLSVCPTKASSLVIFITFVNPFHFNLVVMFVCFTFESSLINLIYSYQHVLIYKIILPVVKAPGGPLYTFRKLQSTR